MTPLVGLQDQTWAPQAQSVPPGALIPAGATWRACFYPVHIVSPGARTPLPIAHSKGARGVGRGW